MESRFGWGRWYGGSMSMDWHSSSHSASTIRSSAVLSRQRAPDWLKVVPEPKCWLVTCSCGWTRECTSRWAAESVTKLHPKLSAPGVAHTLTIGEPPDTGRPRQPELPLV